MIEDPWNPKDNEIKAWAFSSENWPEQDWDLAVCNGENDDLLYRLANDLNCPKQRFFIHTLYFMVGDAMHCEEVARQIAINIWLATLPKSEEKEIEMWKMEARKTLSGNMKFEYDYWCDIALKRIAGQK